MLVAVDLANRKLILGLEAENIRRLLDDRPIERRLDDVNVPDLAGWTVYILGPEDLARLVARVGAEGAA